MPKVLIFIDWFAPGYRAGGPTKSIVNFVDHLKEQLDLYVLTTDTDYCAMEPYPGIEPDRWLERDGIHVCYLQKETLSAGKVLKMARQATCPVWYLNGIYSRYFSILPLWLAKKLHLQKLVIAPRGMLSPQTFRSKGIAKQIFLRLMRYSGLYRHAVFQATSDAEETHILALFGRKTRVERVDNLPVKAPAINDSDHEKEPGCVHLLSAARIAPEKNTLYALECLQKCHHHVDFDLYGQIYDVVYWEKCQRVIAALPPNVKVRVHGALAPELLYQKIREADFFYLPSCGENFGHAIAESLQLGRPVIISERTPWRDLEKAGVGWDLPLETPERFSAIIDQCAQMSAAEWQRMSSRTAPFAEKQLQTEENLKKTIKLFQLDKAQVMKA